MVRSVRQIQPQSRGNEPWTDSELEIAVSTYLYLCRLESRNIPYSVQHITRFVLAGPLKNRNEASVRYRLRNISYVFKLRGLRVLKAFSPATQVGAGVQARIQAILSAYPPSQLPFLRGTGERSTHDEAGTEAVTILGRLDKALSELEAHLPGMGHNRPPETIDDTSLSSLDVRNARSAVSNLQREAVRPLPDKEVINSAQVKLVEFGLRLTNWLGRRVTKFTDAALLTLAPIAVAKATDVLPLLVEALKAALRMVH